MAGQNWCLYWTLLCALVIRHCNAASVQTTLEAASWPSDQFSPLREAAEHLSALDSNLFWKLLDMDTKEFEGRNATAMATKVASLMSSSMTPLQSRILGMSLAFRVHAPAVLFYKAEAEDAFAAARSQCKAEPVAWAAVGATTVCTPEALLEAVSKSDESVCSVGGDDEGGDHAFPNTLSDDAKVPTVVVFGTVGTEEAQALHQQAKDLVKQGKARYVFKHAPKRDMRSEGSATPLAGYGIVLDIKNMEYKTIDDSKKEGEKKAEAGDEIEEGVEVDGIIFSTLIDKFPDERDNLVKVRNALLAKAAAEAERIKVWKLRDMGLAAMQRIVQADDPLSKLMELSQNFPLHARSLTEEVMSDEVRAEVTTTAKRARSWSGARDGESVLWINGIMFNLASVSFNIFEMLENLNEECALMANFNSLNLPAAKHDKVVQFAARATKEKSQGSDRLDIRSGAKGALHFFNNLEKDARYSAWPKDLSTILTPTWSLHQIARNLYTVIAVVDPASETGLETIAMFNSFVEAGQPIRFGIVTATTATIDARLRSKPLTFRNEGELSGAEVSLLVYHAKQQYSHTAGTAFLEALNGVDGPFTVEATVEAFAVGVGQAMSAWSTTQYKDFALEVLANATKGVVDPKSLPVRGAEYAASKGLRPGNVLVNGKVVSQGGAIDEQTLMQAVYLDTRRVQMGVHERKLKPKANVLQFFLKGALSRYHAKASRAFTTDAVPAPPSTDSVPFLPAWKSSANADATLFVCSDWLTENGREVAYHALDFLNRASGYGKKKRGRLPRTRVAVLHSGAASASLGEHLAAFGTPDYGALMNLFSSQPSSAKPLSDEATATLKAMAHICGQTFKVSGPGSAVVCNGHRIVTTDAPLLAPDIQLLLEVERTKRSKHLRKILGKSASADRMLRVASVLGRYAQRARTRVPSKHAELPHSSFAVNGGASGKSALNVVAIVNPISEEAQRMSPVLRTLHKWLGDQVSIQVYLNPVLELEDFPVKRYFRLVTPLSEGPLVAAFKNVPPGQLLTMKIETPEAWIVYQSESVADTDNIKLDATSAAVTVKYNLQHLLVSGQCHDTTHGQPPNGLQLELTEQSASSKVDTVVMQNLGYFQLKANAGAWRLSLANGRASELYEISNAVGDSTDLSVTVRSFSGSVTQLSVKKRAGKEKEELLVTAETADAPTNKKGMWGSLRDLVSGVKPTKKKKSKPDKIHVFSLATGKLYERLLRIMMLSVSKRASVPVKFWLLGNFLSPGFKKIIPQLAKKFGYEVEIVTYKWPSWLRRQTEKQRIIWGYKILFLDVLFPLDIEKVIYVDADQVVRADLLELWEMDLEGAPYGYTPFCDSNKDTLGYQFWRKGYWSNHLQGRPYHISALYVVDLNVFRQTAVGDKLRAVYDNLSRDPASLSNLDQDLPNYAQNIVPIFSLPQDWLWCESWCSMETKATSKTIDLCNHPATKQPKLDMAKRIISGELFEESWTELDDEIANVISEL